MIQENEVMMFLVGLGVLIFVLGSRSKLKRISSSGTLFLAFYLAFGGWVFTVLEGFLWNRLLNFIEHACYAGSSIMLALWAGKSFRNRKGQAQ